MVESIDTTKKDLELLKKQIACSELSKLQSLYPEIDFTDILESEDGIAEFLKQAIQRYAMTAEVPLSRPDAPKLNEDFSNYFVINNLPKVPDEKIPKLVMLLQKSLQKKNLKIEDSAIEMPINPETN